MPLSWACSTLGFFIFFQENQWEWGEERRFLWAIYVRWLFMVYIAGEAFHPSDHQHTDLSVPPNSPTGLSSQHSSLVPPKPSCGQHSHAGSLSSGATAAAAAAAAHTSFSPLVPNLHNPSAKLGSPSPDSPTSIHKPSPCKNSHIPAVNLPHNKLGTSIMGCSHPCNGHSAGTAATSNVNHLTTGSCRSVLRLLLLLLNWKIILMSSNG